MKAVLEALKECDSIEKLSICGFNGNSDRAELTMV
jgi:hypothetical protein